MSKVTPLCELFRRGTPLRQLVGARVTVRGDGTCWLYAVMAGLGLLEHVTPAEMDGLQLEKLPTKRDYELSAFLAERMKNHVPAMTRMSRAVTEPEGAEGKSKLPKILSAYEMLQNAMAKLVVATPSKDGSYGGIDNYTVLSNLLNVQIYVLDQGAPDTYTRFEGNTKGTSPKYRMNMLETHLREARKDNDSIVVVEFNGAHDGAKGHAGGHFAAYIPPEGAFPELPLWLQSKAGGK